MKRRVITGTLIVLTSLSGQPVKADCIQQAQFDAREDVKNARSIDEQVLADHDEEYVSAYLAEYENAAKAKEKRQDQEENTAEMRSSDNHFPEQSPQVTDDQQVYQPQQPSVTQAKFINRLAPAAQQIGKEFDLYPSVIIAQAALESNWGCSSLGKAPNNNLFGVKGYFARQTVAQPTTEYDKEGHRLHIVDNFRQYSSEYEALRDYAQTLEDPLYENVHRQNASDYRQATKALRGRYATDPNYDRKLNQLIDTYQLTKYDNEVDSGNEQANPVPIVEHEKEASPRPVSTNHPVQAKKGQAVDIPPFVPLLGGVGTAGMIEVFRRLLKQKKRA